jgi:hypothetical protein
MELKIDDLVQINIFDDGNKDLKYENNVWKIIQFKFNKGKSIIKNVENSNLKPLSISSWKLKHVNYNIWNQEVPE